MPLAINSLGTRITLMVLVFCAAIAAVFSGAMFYAQSQFYYETRQRLANQFAANVVKTYPDLSNITPAGRKNIEERFAQLLLLEPGSAMYLIDNDGKIMAGYSMETSGTRATQVSLAPLDELMRNPMNKVTLGDDPDFPSHPCLFGAAPLSHAGVKTGYLYVILRPQENYVRELLMTSYANRSALGIAVGTTLLSALMVWALLSMLTRPLRTLTAAADTIRQTSDHATLPALPYGTRRDEIGRLSRAFSSLLARLGEQLSRIQRMDATRREWVVNISHDLRTPLTSLTGHLETVQLRGAHMNEAQRTQFIDTALQNARHIDKLSASLLDFARLDSDDVPLDKAPTPVGELLDDLAARFAATAAGRSISLTAQYPPGLPLINIDTGLIERALANLLDNALRYTPSGGKLQLGASDAKRWLMLTVCDTGPGIAQDDLPHIFERFYQSKQHREGRGHAGLGLAIVKRIAQLHGGQVSVQNRPKEAGGGAKFTVALPLQAGAASNKTAL
jgi:two-component system, OmpR family, sensor kinase